MTDTGKPIRAQAVDDISVRNAKSGYPSPFSEQVAGRHKRKLGDAFGIGAFGVNHTRLEPGAVSALLHRHTVSEEFVYVLEGSPTLITQSGEQQLEPHMVVGFIPAHEGHQIANRTDQPVILLEIGDRRPGDEGVYPNDDLAAAQDADGQWVFLHKDGSPYR
jgi:uncharacterized cupin superfamily protein